MRVAIVGSGLIGGSIGLALKDADPSATITLYDARPAAAARAVERGAGDRAASSLEDAVRSVDVVFVATPVRAIAPVVLEAARHALPGTLFTDVGSTKSRVVLDIEGSLPEGVHFVGGHPMAGTEQEGVEAARADMFAGSWWILTPTERSDPASYQRLLALLTAMRARVMALDPDEHDRLLAVISHVPQLTATTLMNLAAERGREHGGMLALAAGGFRDVTRVAASNPEIWLDICRENREAIAEVLSGFADRLLGMRERILAEDEEALRVAFLSAREARKGLPGKDVAGDLYELAMPVPDRPGVLAEVTTTVGNLGINIEDLQISHSSEGGRGVLHVAVVGEEAASRVAEVLAGLGYAPTVTRV